jgi:hypothetical protein
MLLIVLGVLREGFFEGGVFGLPSYIQLWLSSFVTLECKNADC